MKTDSHRLMTPSAVAYGWRQLAKRVGAPANGALRTGFEGLSIAVHYDHPDGIQAEQPSVIVKPCAPDALEMLLSRAPGTLSTVPAETLAPVDSALPFRSPMPVLLWGEGCEDGSRPFAEQREDGSVVFHADIVAAAVFMLSRWEETVVADRDEHGRFPAAASVAYKQGFLGRPIIDEYALILKEWLKFLVPRWDPEPLRFRLNVSCDIDATAAFHDPITAVRMLAGDLIKRRNPRLAWLTSLDAISQVVAPKRTSYFHNLMSMASLSREAALDSAFYFMAAEPARRDSGYDPGSPPASHWIQSLQQRGFRVGFHPGYHTYDDVQRLAAEKKRLDAVLEGATSHSRQHYLRFRVPDTWRHLERVGVICDSTMGYASHEGFRCGTCHPFAPYDVEEDCPLALRELPVIVMDATLRSYRGFNPAEAEDRILQLARRCKRVSGTFTLVWHLSSLSARQLPWTRVYPRVIARLGRL